MGMDSAQSNNALANFWDESDVENAGVPIPQTNGGKGRNAITPFSSGSLPKGSGEYARLRAREMSQDPEDEYEQLLDPVGELEEVVDFEMRGHPPAAGVRHAE